MPMSSLCILLCLWVKHTEQNNRCHDSSPNGNTPFDNCLKIQWGSVLVLGGISTCLGYIQHTHAVPLTFLANSHLAH
jgi:hypothetical protein